MAQKALPGEVKRGYFDQFIHGLKAFINPIMYSADQMSERQRISTATQIELHQSSQAWDQKKFLLAEMQRVESLAFQEKERAKDRQHQTDLANLNRQLQWGLAEYNQKLQAYQGQLNRDVQRELTALNQDFQRNEGRLNREHAVKLEHFRAEVQRWALEQQLDLQLKRMAFDEREQAKNRDLQEKLAEQSLQSQEHQNRLNRELQRELTEWNQQFQRVEGQLSRQLQRELNALNQDFQAHQGQLNREHALKLERFRAQVQAWALEQQRELQLELKRLDAELARELRETDRKNALAQLRESKRLGHLPIGLLSEQILSTEFKQPLPLRIFFSPPSPRFGESPNPSHVVKRFTFLEDALSEASLARGIRQLSAQYSTHGRPIDFIGGAWKDKSTQSIAYEAAATAVFTELKTEPILILNSVLNGFDFDLHFAFWASNWAKPRYKSITSFSWLEMLYDFAKSQALRWQKQTVGQSKEQILALYGDRRVKEYLDNLKMWQREQEAIALGIGLEEIDRYYHLQQKQYDELSDMIATHHSLVAALLADEYFLVHVPREVRQRPLLPSLLSSLLQDAPPDAQQEFTALMVEFYQTLCKALGEEESTWLPEISLDIALSLTDLPDKSWAKQQIAHSIRAWMALRGMEPVDLPENGDISLDILIDAMRGGLMTMSDHEYLAKLDECLSALYR